MAEVTMNGGGIAGLVAVNRLVDRGVTVTGYDRLPPGSRPRL